MPIFSAAFAAISVAAGSFFTAAGIGSFVLQTVVGVGLSYAARALAGRPAEQQPAANRAVGVQGTLLGGGDVPRSFPLGRCVTAGSLVWANFWGQDGETPNAYFTQVIALSDLPLPSDPTRVFVNGEAVDLAYFNPHAEFGIPVVQYYKDGRDHLWVKFYDGTQTTADSFVTNKAASSDRPWGPTRVGKGVAYVIVTSLVNDELYSGFPTFKWELPPVSLYDPSRDDTAGGSGSQRWSDPATWGGDGDDLPAVQIYNVLRGINLDGSWLYGLQGLPEARLPDAEWINAINACRSPITGEDGSEATYRSGHELRVDVQFADTVEALLTACHGRLAEIGGVYKMRAGPPGAPVVSFTDDDIISTEEQGFTPFFGLADKITGINATYPEPEEAWVIKGAPPLFDAALEERYGRRLLSDVRMNAVPYAAQVQRLMRSALQAAQRARRHTHVMPPSWVLIEPLDVVEWSSERNGYESKLFEADGLIDKDNGDQLVDMTEVDPSDYDWDHNLNFTPVSRNPIGFVRPGAQAIVDWFAEGVIIADANGSPRRPAILLEWNNSVTADIAGVQFEVRNDFGDQDVVHRGRTDSVGAGSIAISQNLLPNTAYEVRGRYIPSNPRETLWSDWLAVTTPDVRLAEADFRDSIRYQIKELQDLMASEINDLKAKLKAAGNQDARNWLDKQQVRNDLSTRVGAAFASISEVRTVAVNTQQAFAAYQITVNAQLGEISSSVEVVAEAVADLDGWAASRYAITLDTNGHAIGFELFNGGDAKGVATFRVDKFELFLTGVGNKAPFVAGTINGVATFGITGNLLLDGSVKAWNIEAGAVKAVHIEAESISTRELAINGVAFENLIAGAATNAFSWSGAARSISSFGAWESLGSTAKFFPGGRIAILANVSWSDGTVTIPQIVFGPAGSSGPQLFLYSASSATSIRVLIDGNVVWQRKYTNLVVTVPGVGPVTVPQLHTPTISIEVSLTSGVHSIELQALRDDLSLGTIASQFDETRVVVTELRK